MTRDFDFDQPACPRARLSGALAMLEHAVGR